MRLEALAEAVCSLHPSADDVTAGGRVSVDIDGGWALDDGTARYVLGLRPTPTVEWERALRAFEHATFTPSTSRRPIHNAVVSLVCSPDEIGAEAEELERRVGLFTRSLVG
jgi:hypothetical protein